MSQKLTLKQKYLNYCKKYDVTPSKDTYKVFLIDQNRKKKAGKAANIDNFFQLINDMVRDDYQGMTILERYNLFYTFSSQARTIEKYKCRFGETIGQQKWDGYCGKQADSNTFEYKQEKHGWTREQFDEYNASRAVTLKNLIARHGEEKGQEMWAKYCERQSYAGVKLEYFIEKYGKEEGTKFYEELNKQKAITLENMIKKYGETEGYKRYDEFLGNLKCFYSEISQELFNILLYFIPDKENVFYATHNGEKKFISLEASGMVDFAYNNKVIEFYGDYWHLNPQIFDENKTIFKNGMKYTAADLSKREEHRIKVIESLGYDVLIVWENDYRKNKEQTVIQCLEFLNVKLDKKF